MIYIGDMHMLALTHDCAVYSWGLNSDGQCATGDLDSLLVTKSNLIITLILIVGINPNPNPDRIPYL